jgi:Uma2 family endonuclease
MLASPTSEALEFPGCRPVHIPRSRIADHEGRFEYWDADTEVAMVVREPTTTWHEHPSQRLRDLATLIAAARGSPIETFGTADLAVLGPKGDARRILQADQCLYLRPLEEAPGRTVEVGEDALPHVVLEVDLTTDVYRGKLSLYEAWGFPEVWVEVPDRATRGRRSKRQPSLRIHVRGQQGFRRSPVSLAFPGWTAEEIHRAMNEPTLSPETVAVLRRVGRVLGTAEGTGPDDHAFLGEERRESRAEGRAEMLHSIVVQTLTTRGVSVPSALAERLAAARDDSAEAAMKAALTCRDEADFLRLLDRPAPS